MSDAIAELQTLLKAALPGSASVIFAGPYEDDPDTQVSIVPFGGTAPIPETGGCAILNKNVNVFVRGEVNDRDTTWALAQSVFSAIMFSDSPSTDHFRIVCSQSQPLGMGKDSKNRHRYSINVEMTALE